MRETTRRGPRRSAGSGGCGPKHLHALRTKATEARAPKAVPKDVSITPCGPKQQRQATLSLFADASGRCVVERMGRRASGAAPSLTVCQGGRRKSKLPKAPFQRPLPNSSSPGRPRIFKFALGGAPPTANLPRASGSYVGINGIRFITRVKLQ